MVNALWSEHWSRVRLPQIGELALISVATVMHQMVRTHVKTRLTFGGMRTHDGSPQR